MSEEEQNITTKKRRIIVGIILLILVIIIMGYSFASWQLSDYLEECPKASYEITDDGTCEQQTQDLDVLDSTAGDIGNEQRSLWIRGVLTGIVFISVILYEILPTFYRRTDYYKRSIESKKKADEIQKLQFSEMSLRSTQKHNRAMGEDEITRLKSIADLRDSGVLTDDEFQEQKSKILSETSPQSNDNLSFKGYTDLSNLSLGKGVAVGIVVGVIILISITSVLSFLDGGGPMRAYVEGEYASGYEMCWSGAFHNGDSIISISGCGTETFHCTDKDSCSINAQKDEDNSYELCVSIGSREACTTAAYGVAQV